MITIRTATELQNISADMTADYELGCDIDLSSLEKWTPIGTAGDINVAFNGTLNGNGYKIKNMTISVNSTYERNLVGLFRMLGNCTIKNLVIENATINSTGYNNCIGILAGGVYYKAPQIENVSVQGTMNITHNYLYNSYAFRAVGGFIGSCYGDSTYMTFNDCISNVNLSITGSSRSIYVGGFIGYLRYAKLYRCYCFGDINVLGESTQYLNIGGFCPHQYTTLNSSCASAVSIIGATSSNSSSCCKYLTETSGFNSLNSKKVWSGATFSYESYVSDSDTTFNESDMETIIGADNLSKYNLTDLDFANGKYLKLAIDTESTEIIHDITINGVTYNGVKKIIYNGKVVTKLTLNGTTFDFTSSSSTITAEVVNNTLTFSNGATVEGTKLIIDGATVDGNRLII